MPEFDIESAADTHKGRGRGNNQDYVAYYEPTEEDELLNSGRLYIVADGVGGATDGDRASRYAAQRVLYDYFQDDGPNLGERLRRAMVLASDEIYDYAESSGRFIRMATTMVAAAVHDEVLTVANIGDSRAYLIRSGQIRQITRDHTTPGMMEYHGEITEEEAMSFRGKNQLLRSLGAKRDALVDVFEERLEPGDTVVLCSDGLSRYATRAEILRLTSEGQSQDIVERCINYANDAGGADNISVAILRVGELIPDGMLASYLVPQPSHLADTLVAVSRDWLDDTDVGSWRRRQSSRLALWLTGAVATLLAIGLGTWVFGLVPSRITDKEAGTGQDQPQGCIAVSQSDLTMYAGPDTASTVLGTMLQGEQAQLQGRTADGAMWQVNYPPGQLVWIVASGAEHQGDCSPEGLTVLVAGDVAPQVPDAGALAEPSAELAGQSELSTEPASGPTVVAGCVHVVQPEEGLVHIAENFGFALTPELQSDFRLLERTADGMLRPDPITILPSDDPTLQIPDLEPDDLVLVPLIDDPTLCGEKGGQWMENILAP